MKKSYHYIAFTITLMIGILVGFFIIIYSRNKPNIDINICIDGLENETYYVTLLSSEKSVDNAQAYNGTNGIYEIDDPMYSIWYKFLKYEDEDGYFFLQKFVECHGNTSFMWDVYIPESFKILLYFPNDNTFVSTNIRSEEWTDYYVIHMDEVKDDVPYIPIKTYYKGIVLFFLLIRIFGAVWVDFSIALLFGYRDKKILYFIGIISGILNSILHIYLSFISYREGALVLLAGLILCGGIIIGVKAILYNIFIPIVASQKIERGKLFIFSIVTLFLSDIIGGISTVLYIGAY